MRPFFTLDIETGAAKSQYEMHAGLEPWGLRTGRGKITSVAVCRPDKSVVQIVNDGDSFRDKLCKLLAELQGQVCYAHNAVFDLAWVIAYLRPERMSEVHPLVQGVEWRDSMLLAKWLLNSQQVERGGFSFSLANLVQTYLSGAAVSDFVDMKKDADGEDSSADYWLARGRADVIMTHDLVRHFSEHLPKSMVIGLLTEFRCLVPVAKSWLVGIRIDTQKLDSLEPALIAERDELLKSINVSPSVVASPKQLGRLLYSDWGLPILNYTPSGAASSSKDDLAMLRHRMVLEGREDLASKIQVVLDAKNIATQLSKYVATTKDALSHTGDGFIYGAPRIFGTYTGRFTYSNATKGRAASGAAKQFKTGIALHQIPRKAKAIRELLLPPEGYGIYEADAAGQESRLMAIRSNDEAMLTVFRNNLNFHSATGASIIGMDYTEFEAARAEEERLGVSHALAEKRQMGKLTNLSCNYRISGRALSSRALISYDLPMSVETGEHLVNTFKRAYPRVAEYWRDIVRQSMASGYVEAFGGRRFGLSEWSKEQWSTESSAINFPIQSAGASMKEIAIGETYAKHGSEAIFALDLHDATFLYVAMDKLKSVAARLDATLKGISYERYWGFTPAISLPYDSKHGVNFSQVK